MTWKQKNKGDSLILINQHAPSIGLYRLSVRLLEA
jgi:hypothetical protein